jgi:hypothetical protein
MSSVSAAFYVVEDFVIHCWLIWHLVRTLFMPPPMRTPRRVRARYQEPSRPQGSFVKKFVKVLLILKE